MTSRCRDESFRSSSGLILPQQLLPRTVGQCDITKAHYAATIPSDVSQIYFECQYEIPLPWHYMLDEYGRHLFRVYGLGCTAGLELCYPRGPYLTGLGLWRLHCHCDKPNSLFCKAAAQYLKTMLCEFVRGMRYNSMFPQYRPYTNRGLSMSLTYIGSIMFRNKHFIYLEFANIWDLEVCVDHVSFGEGMVVCGLRSYIIFVCTSCRNLLEINACSCMRRTRMLIKRCLIVMNLMAGSRTIPNYREEVRNRMFCRYWRYGLPIRSNFS